MVFIITVKGFLFFKIPLVALKQVVPLLEYPAFFVLGKTKIITYAK